MSLSHHVFTSPWQTPRDLRYHNKPIAPCYIGWLLDKGSLTQKLIEQSHNTFAVKVLEQSIRPVPFSERQALGITHRRWAVIREVLLYGKHKPWVYARTVIPLSTVKGPLRYLNYWGNKSLGEALFTHPTMQREPVHIAPLPRKAFAPKIQHYIPPNSTTIWGRRSVFKLSNKPLLVSEFFLPELFNH